MIVSAYDFARYRADYCEAPASIKIMDSTKEGSACIVIFPEAIFFLQKARWRRRRRSISAASKILQPSIRYRYQLDKAKVTVF